MNGRRESKTAEQVRPGKVIANTITRTRCVNNSPGIFKLLDNCEL